MTTHMARRSAVRGLAARYESCFDETLGGKARTIGREAEYPVVWQYVNCNP